EALQKNAWILALALAEFRHVRAASGALLRRALRVGVVRDEQRNGDGNQANKHFWQSSCMGRKEGVHSGQKCPYRDEFQPHVLSGKLLVAYPGHAVRAHNPSSGNWFPPWRQDFDRSG